MLKYSSDQYKKKKNSPSNNWREKRKFKDVYFLTWN